MSDPAGPPAAVQLHRLGGSGPDMVLLHGFGADRLSWLATAPALQAVGTVYTLDLPGHATGVAAAGDGSLSTLCERISDALDAADLRRVHFVGHSLGGGLALLFAHRRPHTVASLALIAPAGLGVGIDGDFLMRYPALLETAEATELLRRLVVRPHLIGRQVVARALDALAKPGAREALRQIAEALIAGDAQLRAAVAAVAASTLPRLVVWGSDDGINPPSAAHLAAFGGETHILPGAGHLPHIESAATVNALLTGFFAAHGAARAADARR